jgi:hypothetical protein
MVGSSRLTPRCLRPLGDARCTPHAPTEKGRSAKRNQAFQIDPPGVWGLANENSRAASVPRERSGVEITACVFSLSPQQLTACAFNALLVLAALPIRGHLRASEPLALCLQVRLLRRLAGNIDSDSGIRRR